MQCTIKLIHINSITQQIVNAMLQIENLEFSYHKKGNPIFNGINLTIQPGSVYGLLGKNGIGKSTLLYMMCGLMFPHKGSIRFDGIEVKRRLPETLEKIFLVPEEFDLPSISIDDYVRRNSVFYPNFNIDQFNQYLSDFELEHTKNLAKTSMGQKKKYLVSFALATNTPLLLMDEPTNGMDIPSKSQFRKVIASGMNEQKSIVISTHQVRDLENMFVLFCGGIEYIMNYFGVTYCTVEEHFNIDYRLFIGFIGQYGTISCDSRCFIECTGNLTFVASFNEPKSRTYGVGIGIE